MGVLSVSIRVVQSFLVRKYFPILSLFIPIILIEYVILNVPDVRIGMTWDEPTPPGYITGMSVLASSTILPPTLRPFPKKLSTYRAW